MGRLQGKVSIVSGGARGLGGGIAEAMAAEGAIVIVTDVLEEAGEESVAALRAAGHAVEFMRLDVRHENNWQDVIQAVIARHGRLDCLVNNAGINIPVTIDDVTEAQFRTIIDINLIGTFLGIKTAVEAMKGSGGGVIINIASSITAKPVPLGSIYGATKAGVANLTKSTATHCAQMKYNIRVNSIHPGAHETQMLLGDGGARTLDLPQIKALIESIPMQRLGEPKDIGAVAVFLASDESRYITGAEIPVDGGLIAS